MSAGRTARFSGAVGLSLALLALAGSAAAARQGETTLISTRNPGAQANDRTVLPRLSSDGRVLAFTSRADNLAPGGAPVVNDVYWRHRITGEVRRVSVSPAGTPGNGNSFLGALSANGQVLVFAGSASNLVPNDTNDRQDIFVYDAVTRITTRASVDSSGAQADRGSGDPAISADGRFVAFWSDATNLVLGDTNGAGDIFVHDRLSGITELVSVGLSGTPASGHSGRPSLSADGRYVAFTSSAADLVAGDTNGLSDVFVRDRWSGVTTRVSVDSSGAQASGLSDEPCLSHDGRYVAFQSTASNLVPGDTNNRRDIFVHDRLSGATTRVSVSSTGVQADNLSHRARISADGRYVTFESTATTLVPGDANGLRDIFLHDRLLATTQRVSVGSGGLESNGLSESAEVSADGRYVAFNSLGSNLTTIDLNADADVFVRDRLLDQTTLEGVCGFGTAASARSDMAQVSRDGRFVAFQSSASDIVALDTNGVEDVFVQDRLTGLSQRVSVSSTGEQASGPSHDPRISADGRCVLFGSPATNLVAGGSNGWNHVYLRDRWLGLTERITVGNLGHLANNNSYPLSISASGRYVVFLSAANNLLAQAPNAVFNIFLKDRQLGMIELISQSTPGTPGNGHSFTASVSDDGRYVAFASLSNNLILNDTNAVSDIFVRDRVLGETRRVSVPSGGGQGNGPSSDPGISGDGRYVAFPSSASNLVQGDINGFADILLHDLQTQQTTLVSVAWNGQVANGASFAARPSSDGRYVAFQSAATNLVVGDTTIFADIYLRDRQLGVTHLISVDSQGVQSNGHNSFPTLSPDGRYVAFASEGSNLVAHDTNGADDVFLRDRTPLAPVPFCYGDGSGTACPCGNPGAHGHGCANGGTASGARLAASGESSVSSDTLILEVSSSAPSNPGLLFQGNQAVNGYAGAVLGGGLVCVGGGVIRLQNRLADASGTAASTIAVATHGAVSPGDVKYYQWWYRDPLLAGCQSGTNLSNGLRVLWVP